jgi:hypothetical protein
MVSMLFLLPLLLLPVTTIAYTYALLHHYLDTCIFILIHLFEACTKGLWIWTEVIPSHRDDGKPVNILVIDTEGIGALSADHTHDTRIFTLALLLSSLFV